MAKPSKPITISEEDLKNLDAIREKYQKLSEQYEEIRRKGAAITNDEKRRKAFLERKIERQAAYVEKLEQEAKIREGIVKRTEKFNNALKKQAQYLGESEEVYGSIAEKLQKGSEGAELIARHLEDQKGALSDIASLGSEIAGTDEKKQKAIQKALTDYKKYESSVANTVQRVSEGTLSQEKANAAIAKAKAAYMENIQSLTEMGEKGEQLLQLFTDLTNNTVKLGEAASKTAEAFNIMEDTLNRMGNHIPLMGELSETIKKAEEGGKGFTVAMAALGAAVGALAAKYFLAFPQAKIQALNEIAQSTIETTRDVAKIKFDTKFIPDKTRLEINKMLVESEFERSKAVKKVNDLQTKGSAEYRRVLQGVNVEIQQGAMQFTAMSKTALFGKALGNNLGYTKSQLVAAGVSAEDVANNIKQAGVVMGQMPSEETAATMALMEKRTGVSAESIAQINKSFIKLDGFSETAAMNMQEGMTALAESSNIPLDNLMQEVAGSAKSMLGYGIKNTSSLIKQAAAVSSMGVSFQEVANAGKSMVLNYKDSIKAEMQLSSLLGEQVDLSEVRAQMASGDYKGAIQSLQAQGLDIQEMNQFQLEALSQSLGGMDVGTMTSLLTGKIKEPGELKASDAKAAGADFAGKKLAEKNEIALGSAIIQAKDAKAQIQFDKEIQKEILNSDFYNQYQLNQAALDVANRELEGAMDRAWKATDAYAQSIADLAKLDVTKSFTENLIPALSSALGAGLFAMLSGGGFGKLGQLLGLGGGTVPTPGGPGGGGMLSTMFNPKTMSKGLKIGGAALAGIFGGFEGYSDAKEKGKTTEQALGAGAVQGGAAIGGTLIGAAFGGPVGAAIGGFVGNFLGEKLNEYAPWLGNAFGGMFEGVKNAFKPFSQIWDSITAKFSVLLEKLGPVGEFLSSIGNSIAQFFGGEGGPLSQFISLISEFAWDTLLTPFRLLFSALGSVIDIVTAVVQVFQGDFAGAWQSVKSAFSGLFDAIITPFKSIGVKIYNFIADSWLGKTLGMEVKAEPKAETKTTATTKTEKTTTVTPTKTTTVAPTSVATNITQATADNLNKVVAENINVQKYSNKLNEENKKNLQEINTNTKAMVQLTKALEAIAAAQYQYDTTGKAPIQLVVDGKKLAEAQISYMQNNKGQKAPGKS